MESIARQPIRNHSYRQLLENIVRGDIPPGARIRDTEIAAELGISRTPVRESLLRLTNEGFLENLPGRGFRVRPLDPTEVQEIYPILWNLETLALLSSPLPGSGIIKNLKKMGTQIGADDQDPIKRIEIDELWHRCLISGCPNRRLLELIDHYKSVIRRYLFTYILRLPRIKGSIDDHALIIRSLERGDLETAAARIKPHYENNIDYLIQALGECRETE